MVAGNGTDKVTDNVTIATELIGIDPGIIAHFKRGYKRHEVKPVLKGVKTKRG